MLYLCFCQDLLTSFFPIGKMVKLERGDNVIDWTKVLRERRAKYKEDNRERLLAQAKEYRDANKEAKAAHSKKYYEANREKIIAVSKKYYEANKEEVLEKRRARRVHSKNCTAELGN